MRLIVRLGCIALAAPLHAAANEPINAERPGFSSSPFTLAPSTLQIESGYQYTREAGSSDFDAHTLPLLLIRAGLIERVEIQLSWAGYSWLEAGGGYVSY